MGHYVVIFFSKGGPPYTLAWKQTKRCCIRRNTQGTLPNTQLYAVMCAEEGIYLRWKICTCHKCRWRKSKDSAWQLCV